MAGPSGSHPHHAQRPGNLKRAREEIVVDPTVQLLGDLFYLGNDALPTLRMEKGSVVHVVQRLRRRMGQDAGGAADALLKCVFRLPHKIPLYALLIGLLNADEPEAVAGLLARLESSALAASASVGELSKGRLALRLLAALTAVNVVDLGSLLARSQACLQQLIRLADDSADLAPAIWQPYCDYMVYSHLTALPFADPVALGSLADQAQAIAEAGEEYLKRRRLEGDGLRPFLQALSEEDELAWSDGGRASFTPEVVTAFRELVADPSRAISSIPRLHTDYEIELATGKLHPVPYLTVREEKFSDGGNPVVAAARMLGRVPPRHTLQLLDAKHTHGDRPGMEKILVEDYILDGIDAFEANRVECAKLLAHGLPVGFAHEPLLCQTIFGQMLALPRPGQRPVMHGTLMVELCKLCKLFPRAMSACVRECFARMPCLDVDLRFRLAEWLAYQLSCFEYVWPWSKWQDAVQRPVHDPQRRFVVLLLDKLSRLSYWDRIHGVVPPEFQVLLPAKPEPTHAESGAEPAFKELVAKIRAKTSAEDMDVWLDGLTGLGELDAHGGVLLRAILEVGSKSYTHMLTLLERYAGPLSVRAKAAGKQAEVSLLHAAFSVWRLAPQRMVMAVDRMMTLRLISAEATVEWIFQQRPFESEEGGLSFITFWEVLHCALNKAVARVQDAEDDLRGHGLDRPIDAESDVAAFAAAHEDVPADDIDYMTETLQQQQGTFLAVLRCFAEQWDEGEEESAAEVDADEAGDAGPGQQSPRQARAQLARISLVAILREYNLAFAQLTGRVAVALGDTPGASPVKAVVAQFAVL